MNSQPPRFVDLLEHCRTHDPKWLSLAYGVGSQDLEILRRSVRGPVEVPRRHSLCPQGSHCDSLYVVYSGSFKSYIFEEDGRTQIVGFRFAGELLGIDALHDGRHHCTSTALETSQVFKLPGERIEDVVRAVPGLERELFRLMSQRIREDEEHMLVISQKSAAARLAVYLLNLNHRQHDGSDPSRLYLPMTRQDLGDFLGLAAETVSRVVASFSDDGLVEIPDRKHLVLRDPPGLARLAGLSSP